MRVLPSWKSLGGVVRRQNRPNYLSEREGGSREEFRGPSPPLPKICIARRNNGPQTPITDHHSFVRSHVATRSQRQQGARAIPAPTGQSIPAQGSALGIRPRTFPHSNGTPQMVASPTRARTMRRSFRAHPYPPSMSRMHVCCPIPQGCTLGWYALTLWVKWNPALSQGCTLSWYALTLWVKRKAAPISAPGPTPVPRQCAAGR